MALFLSRSVHKVDKKGRVSVPAAFRSALGDVLTAGLALTKPVNRLGCIEAAPMARAYERLDQLARLNQDSPQYSALAMVTLGNMRETHFDPEGRIVLPGDLMAHAGIDDSAVFVGMGRTFQIWQSDRLDAYMLQAEELAAQNLALLNPTPPATAPSPIVAPEG